MRAPPLQLGMREVLLVYKRLKICIIKKMIKNREQKTYFICVYVNENGIKTSKRKSTTSVRIPRTPLYDRTKKKVEHSNRFLGLT